MERHACLRNRVGVCEWRRHRGGVLAQVDSEPRYHVAVRTPDRSRCSRRYNAGSTSRVSSVEDTMPPITTVASGRCTSAPVPTFSRSEEHTSELQSLMRISYAVFCLKTKKNSHTKKSTHT